jgi:hypothetical protein
LKEEAQMAEKDPFLDETPIPDPLDITPPHGDELAETDKVNEIRNAHSEGYTAADDPDTDRPAK